MYAWGMGLVVRRAFADLSAGRWQRPFRRFARDAVLRFPGDHVLGGSSAGARRSGAGSSARGGCST